LLILSGLIVGGLTSTGRADDGFSRKLHPWGNCGLGAWKMVRVVTKCADESGNLTRINTTETKTTLQQIDDRAVTLQVSTVVEFLGKRFDSYSQTLRQGFHGEPDDERLKTRSLGAAPFVVDGQTIPCSVLQLELAAPECKTITTLTYSDTVAPYVFKRESIVTDAEGTNIHSRTTSEVVALDMPYEVLSDVKSTAEIRTVYRHANGVITTLSFVCPDVPGGVVAHSSKEMDKSGRVTRMSVLKLVGYSFEPEEEERPGLFGRKRPSRFHVYNTIPPSR
jgi:hypothetical protein